MTTLILMRHARAAWAEPGNSDYARPLTADGAADAVTSGMALASLGLFPGHILCSGSARTRETLEQLLIGLDSTAPQTTFDDTLYHGDGSSYLQCIRSHEATTPLLVLGHNPMVEDVAFLLAGDSTDPQMNRIRSGFPPSGIAVFDVEHAPEMPDGLRSTFIRYIEPGVPEPAAV
jgi:phosphohistidine phosphatase